VTQLTSFNFQALDPQIFHRKNVVSVSGLHGAIAQPVVDSNGNVIAVLCAFLSWPLKTNRGLDAMLNSVRVLKLVSQALSDAIQKKPPHRSQGMVNSPNGEEIRSRFREDGVDEELRICLGLPKPDPQIRMLSGTGYNSAESQVTSNDGGLKMPINLVRFGRSPIPAKPLLTSSTHLSDFTDLSVDTDTHNVIDTNASVFGPYLEPVGPVVLPHNWSSGRQ